MTSRGSAPVRPRSRWSGLIQLDVSDGGVGRIELFLDLVFVYAFLNVTGLMAADLRPAGLLQGLLVVLLLWRCWTAYAWLGNVLRLDRGALPPVVFAVATAILLMGAAVPGTFIDPAGHLPSPLVFVLGYVLVRATALVLATYLVRGTVGIRQVVLRAWLPLAGSSALLCGAALLPAEFVGSGGTDLRLVLFLIAALVDLTGLRAFGTGGWQVVSARHWAERHALIVLVALGETIISVGTSRGPDGGQPITPWIIVGALLSIVIVAALWWAYFDIARLNAERALAESSGRARSSLGRDAYSLLHLPMISGLILLALGLEHILTADPATSARREDVLGVLVLPGGMVLYLLGLVGFQWRTSALVARGPLLGTVLVLALAPAMLLLPAPVALTLLAAGTCAMVLADRTIFRRHHDALHRALEPALARSAEVTPKELFVDLVFVYAFIEVTVLMARQPSGLGVVQGMTILALLWWAWCSYAWLANVIRTEAALVRLTVLAIVALTLVLGIAIPQAFSTVPGGLPGPVIVVACYVGIRLLLYTMLRWLTRDQPELRAIARRGTTPSAAALLLLAAAAATAVTTRADSPLVSALWIAAIAVDTIGNYLSGAGRWQIRSVTHWTARFGLIILIAFGEAIIAAGVAADEHPLTGAVLLAIALSALCLACLWWAYFDSDVLLAERALERCGASERAAMARDAYAYLHLPMVAGLILFAYGLGEKLGQVSADQGARPSAPGHLALYYGVVVYLVANQLFWWRTGRQLSRYRVGGCVLLAGLAWVTLPLPALWSLALLSTLAIGFATVEIRRSRGLRRSLHTPAAASAEIEPL